MKKWSKFLTEKRINALVTGGSQGIGKAIALDLALNGYGVVVTARNEKLLNEVCEEITLLGGVSNYVHADIGTDKGI